MNHREEDDPFEEDIVFDQAGLLSTSHKSAIRRISSGKCATFSKTLALCGAFLGLGLTCAIPGPLSPVPPNELNQDISLMSPEIMYRCFGFMIGSMFGAKLLDRFNRLFLVFLALLVTALLVIIIPWCRIAWLLRSDMFLIGGTIGFLSTGGNVLCLDLWGRNSGPFMQALQFSFSLGVFLAPLLSQPLMIPSNNVSIVASTLASTTPGAFPLNRLPRDASALSAQWEGKNAHIVSSTNSSDYTFQPSLPSVLNVSSDALLSLRNSSSSSTLNLSTTGSPTSVLPLLPASSTTAKPSSLSSSRIVLPASLVHAPPSNFSRMDVENSSTTHRVPKPKPELTNSEKLKDKNWENDKFRKPPPEDLVPVSTTMKTTTHLSQAILSVNTSGLFNTSKQKSLTRSSSTTVSKTPSTFMNVTSSPALVSGINVTSSSALVSRMNRTSSPALVSGMNVTSSPALVPKMNVTSFPVLVSRKNVTLSAVVSSPVPTSPALVVSDLPKLSSVTLSSTMPSLPPSSVFYSPEGASPPAAPVVSESNYGKSSTVSSEGLGLKSLSLLDKPLSSTKLPFSPNITDSRDDLDQQTRLLPLLEKPVTEEKSVDIVQIIANSSSQNFSVHKLHTLPVTPQTAEPQKQSEKKQRLPPQLLLGHQHEGVATKLSGQAVAAALSNVSSPEISSNIKVAHNVSSGLSTTVGSTRRTHHSKPASTVVNDTEVTHTVIGAFANRLEKYGLSKMELIYLVVGMVLLATSLLFLGFLCFNPRDPKSKTDEEEANGHVPRARNTSVSSGRQTAPPPLPRWLRNTLMGLMLLILMINSGIQAMYGQLLLVFATQSPLQLSQSTGSALTATFWGALTSSRFACILLASALSPTAMIVLSVALCSCATWLLSALATSSEVALWIGSVMVGVGTASVFPSGLLWMQRYLVVTHRVAAMLVMGPAMGEMLFPMLVYKMMVGVGPGSLVHLPALLSLCVIALWAAAWRLARLPRWQGDNASASGYQLANQNDEDDLLDLTMSPVINGSLVSRSGGRSCANGHTFHRLSS